MPDRRGRRLAAEIARQARRQDRLEADAGKEVVAILRQAQKDIRATLAGAPSDFSSAVLPKLHGEIDDQLKRLGARLGRRLADHAGTAWEQGRDMVDAPLQAGGIHVRAVLPMLDSRQIDAMKTFLVHRGEDIGAEAARRIKAELGLVLIGTRSHADAVTNITGLLQSSSRSRALTIVRTELGRAYEMASQARKEQARQYLPGLKKQWRRSGKLHSRKGHDLADGQVVDVDETFKITAADGSIVELRYPRDPEAPVGEVVNCGCMSIPYMSHWEVMHPADKPITALEQISAREKSAVTEERARSFASWADAVMEGGARSSDFRTVAQLDDDLLGAIRNTGVAPATREIALSERIIGRARRPTKVGRGAAVPENFVRYLPARFSAPRAVLWKGGSRNEMIYAFDVPGDDRMAKVVVRMRARDDRYHGTPHNAIISMGMVPAGDLSGLRVLKGRLR
jgi:hypothetical protein